MFPELFLTDRGANIYDALNKHQEIGQESTKSLPKETNRQHQLAKRLAAHTKRFKPQYAATLRLKCGKWSNNNTVATLQALHKVIMDLLGRSASNRIVQHEGREYQMVKAVAKKWGLENMARDQEENGIRKIGEKEPYLGNEKIGEQNEHQALALRIMRMKILHPQNPSKLVVPGKNQQLVPGLISEAMDKVHQLVMKAPPVTPEIVRQIRNPGNFPKTNIGLVRDLETQLGRAVIHRDCQESNNLAQVGILIANCKRSLNNLYRNLAKKKVEKESKDIVRSILLDDKKDWKRVPTKKAIEALKGVDNFFKAVADSYQIPVMLSYGLSKQRMVREEQRPFLETTRFKIYGSGYLQEKQTDYACIGFKESSQEAYQFMLVNKLYTRDLIKNKQGGQAITELTLSDSSKGIQEIAAADNESKRRDRFIRYDFPHMQIKAWVRRQAYRVIVNSQKNNRYQLPCDTVFQSNDRIEEFLALVPRTHCQYRPLVLMTYCHDQPLVPKNHCHYRPMVSRTHCHYQPLVPRNH